MDKNAYLERSASQQPAIDLLQTMGYIYISPEDCALQRGGSYHVLLKDILRGQLRRLNRYAYAGAKNEFSAANIERAIEDLDEPLTDGLVRTSEKIYDALLLGKSYQEAVGEGKLLSFNLKYIDWECPKNNLFHVTEEFSVESQDKQHNARPDIVLFINGIPFAVIECKAPHIPVEQAVEQMCRNQQLSTSRNCLNSRRLCWLQTKMWSNMQQQIPQKNFGTSGGNRTQRFLIRNWSV